MDISLISKKYGTTSEERMLITRLCELTRRACDRGTPQFLDFLSPAERSVCERVSETTPLADISFVGGYPDAERTLAMISPRGCAYEIKPPITVLALEYKGTHLSHRDILGSIMGLGIKREKIGDILPENDPPVLFCDSVIAEYIINHLERAGKNRVTAKKTKIGVIAEQSKTQKSFTVKSLRLDSIMAEGFAVARSRAVEIIKQGSVYLNWIECSSPSKEVSQGDTITCRGLGRIVVSEIGGKSKKDRTYVTIDRYM